MGADRICTCLLPGTHGVADKGASEAFGSAKYHSTPHRIYDRQGTSFWREKVIDDFMDNILGVECTSLEKQFALQLVPWYLHAVDSIVARRAWTEWPDHPLVGRMGLGGLAALT
ncbi:hypothetical protein AX15_003800 [Amanita polypyramis BW_CC]|nr:hypothetical protein AX15_003800 [Amanita polypyramis BW_CC]